MDITSRDNPRVKELRRLLTDARFRRETGLFVCEGARLCEDAARSGIAQETVLVTPRAQEKYAALLAPVLNACAHVFTVSEELARFLGETESPQGVFSVCRRPARKEGAEELSLDGRYLALEDVQDPANLGAVIRTAEAMGAAGLLLSAGCCDPYSPKVLRASMGGVFRLPLYETAAMAETVARLQKRGFCCYAAVVDHAAAPLTAVRFANGSVCLVGNEGNGLKAATAAACRRQITIPMAGRAESLNAAMAAGILLWEMMKPCDTE